MCTRSIVKSEGGKGSALTWGFSQEEGKEWFQSNKSV